MFCFLDPEMVQEISERLILHWNYRGYSALPEELCICGSHVCELYLKFNNIARLVTVRFQKLSTCHKLILLSPHSQIGLIL